MICTRNFREHIIDVFYDSKSIDLIEELRITRDKGNYTFDCNNDRLFESFILDYIKKNTLNNFKYIINIMCEEKNIKLQYQTAKFIENNLCHNYFVKKRENNKCFSILEHYLSHDIEIVNKIIKCIRNESINNKNLNVLTNLLVSNSECNCIGKIIVEDYDTLEYFCQIIRNNNHNKSIKNNITNLILKCVNYEKGVLFFQNNEINIKILIDFIKSNIYFDQISKTNLINILGILFKNINCANILLNDNDILNKIYENDIDDINDKYLKCAYANLIINICNHDSLRIIITNNDNIIDLLKKLYNEVKFTQFLKNKIGNTLVSLDEYEFVFGQTCTRNIRASNRAINKLCIDEYNSKKDAQISKCTICQFDFLENDKIIKLHKKCYFHDNCLKQWLECNNCCPNCRLELPR